MYLVPIIWTSERPTGASMVGVAGDSGAPVALEASLLVPIEVSDPAATSLELEDMSVDDVAASASGELTADEDAVASVDAAEEVEFESDGAATCSDAIESVDDELTCANAGRTMTNPTTNNPTKTMTPDTPTVLCFIRLLNAINFVIGRGSV